MKKTNIRLFAMVAFVLLCSISCNKESNTIIETPIQVPPPSTVADYVDPLSEFVIAQNYLFEVINIALTQALFTPEMHGVVSNPTADTRTCPTITSSSGSPNILLINFGAGCSYDFPLGGTSSNVSGSLRLEAYGPITDPSTNTFLVFDEIVCGDKEIKFLAGNKAADWIKFQFIGNVADGDFSYSAKLDGTVDVNCDGVADQFFDPVNRSHFEVTCLSTGTSTHLYPFYSGSGIFFGPAFIFRYENAAGTAPEFTYESLASGCFSIDINPIVGYYYDSNGTLVEDYNIRNDIQRPLIYKPECKWVQGGKLIYEDIPTGGNTDPNYSDVIPNPNKEIFYGVNAGNDPNANECDGWVRIESCEQFENNVCLGGAAVQLFECP